MDKVEEIKKYKFKKVNFISHYTSNPLSPYSYDPS
jgi:hypothetical protein